MPSIFDQAVNEVMAQKQQKRQLDPEERDLLIRTVIGEARGQPVAGQKAVAHVVLNRRNSGKWGSRVNDVVMAKNQFEPWSTRRDELLSISHNDPVYQQVSSIIDDLGDDPTGGATHFANVDIVRQRRGGDVTPWMKEMWNTRQQIGDHTFFGGDPLLGGSGASAVGDVATAQRPMSLWELAKGGVPDLPQETPVLNTGIAGTTAALPPNASFAEVASALGYTQAFSTTAENVPEAIVEKSGGVVNTLKGTAETVAGMIGNVFGYSASIQDVEKQILGFTIKSPAEIAAEWAFDVDGNQVRRNIQNYLTEQGRLGYEPRASAEGLWEAAKNGDVVELAEQVVEMWSVSTPWMAASVAGLPGRFLYIAAMGEDIAQQRAKNQGRNLPNAEDLVIATSAAALSAAIERYATQFIFGGAPGRTAIGRVAQSIGVEAGTEAIQEPIEYAGEALRTQKGATAEEAALRSFAGAAVGAFGGGVVSTGAEMAGVSGRLPPESARPIPPLPTGGNTTPPTTGPIALEGTVLERLGGTVSGIKTKFKLSPQEDQQLGGQIAVVRKADVAQQGYLRFENDPDTYASIARTGLDEKDLLFVRAPKDVKDKSALVQDIAAMDLDSQAFENKISFTKQVSEQEKDQALLQVRKAVDALKDYNKSIAARLQTAEELYAKALDLGLRVQPDEDAGFVTSEAPKGIVPVAAPRAESLEQPSRLETIGVDIPGAPGLVGITTVPGAGVQAAQVSKTKYLPRIGFLRPGMFKREDISVNRDRNAVIELLKRQGINLNNNIPFARAINKAVRDNYDDLIAKGVLRDLSNGAMGKDFAIQSLANEVADWQSGAVKSTLSFVPDQDMVPNLNEFDIIAPKDSAIFGTIQTQLRSTVKRSVGYPTYDILGNRVDNRKVQAGDVYFSQNYLEDKKRLSKKDQIKYDRMERFIERLLKRALKELGLEKSTNIAVAYSSDGHFRGAYSANDDGSGVLWLDPFAIIDADIAVTPMDKVLNVFIHELGHAISISSAHDPNVIKKPFLELLMHQYEIDVLRAAINANPNTGALTRETLIPFTAPHRFRELVKAGSYDQTYYLNYEEWMAENAIKYVLNPPTKLSRPLEKFFSIVGQRLKELFKIIHYQTGFYKEDFSTTTAFNLFMEYTRSRENPQAKANFDLLYTKAMESYEWSDELKAYVRPQPETEPAIALIDKVLKDKDQKLQDGVTESDIRAVQTAKLGADYYNNIVKYGWNIIQLAWKNPHIKFLQRYVALADRWQNKKTEIQVRANERLREWKMLGKEQMDATARMLFAIDQMEYLTQDERNKGVVRKPTEAELAVLARKYKINEYSYGLIGRITEDFENILNEIEQAVVENIIRNASDPLMSQLDIQNVRKEFATVKNRPYFPHARFGQFTVVVKDNDGKTVYMEQFERKRDRARALKDIKREFEPQGFTVGEDFLPDSARGYMGIPPSLLQAIKDNLSLTAEQRTALDQLIIASGPAQSFKKRFLHRQNIPGYSLDAMRAFGDYFWHASNHIARITFGQQMQETLLQAGKDTDSLRNRGADVTKRRKIIEFLDDHLGYLMNPGPDWAWARSLAFNWWISGSVASAALNLTQVPMVAAPYLSSRFSNLGALNALKNAAVWVRKVSTDPNELQKRMSAEDVRQIQLAQKQGFIDESQATELAGIATDGVLNRMRHGSKPLEYMARGVEAAGWLFAATEKYNRRVVFRAAVELARANPDSPFLQELIDQREGDYKDALASGMSPQEARAFIAGKDAVLRTQFEYSAYARPRFMRQGPASALFTFFMFKQNMLWFTLYSPGNIKYLLLLGLAGGLMGLPGAEDLAGMVRALSKRIFGQKYDLDLELRRFLVGAFGSEGVADLAINGASRYGFGLPQAVAASGLPPVIPSIDMSQAISQGRIVPGLSEIGREGGFEERFTRGAQDIAGASFGIGFNIAKFLTDQQLEIDDPKRWERLLPRALRDVTRATRYWREEEERSRTGASILKFDLSDPWDGGRSTREHGEVLARGLGFQPTRLSITWDKIIAQREVEQYWINYRQRLLRSFWNAIVAGDGEGKDDVMKAIQRYNSSVPYPQMGIRGEQLIQSIKERRRQQRLAEAGISPQKSMIALGRETQSLFPNPETIIDVEDVKRVR